MQILGKDKKNIHYEDFRKNKTSYIFLMSRKLFKPSFLNFI